VIPYIPLPKILEPRAQPTDLNRCSRKRGQGLSTIDDSEYLLTNNIPKITLNLPNAPILSTDCVRKGLLKGVLWVDLRADRHFWGICGSRFSAYRMIMDCQGNVFYFCRCWARNRTTGEAEVKQTVKEAIEEVRREKAQSRP